MASRSRRYVAVGGSYSSCGRPSRSQALATRCSDLPRSDSTTSSGSSAVRSRSSRSMPARLTSLSSAAWARASSAGSGPGSRSQRASAGSVRPCRDSVPTTTTNATSSSVPRCGVCGRQREHGGQGDHAAHAGPRDEHGRAPGPAVGVDAGGAASRRTEYAPNTQTKRDSRTASRTAPQTTSRVPSLSSGAGLAHHERCLQPDQQEHGVLQQELDRAPVAGLRQPGGAGLQQVRAVPEQQPGDDDGEHPGGVQLLAHEVGHERRQQREHRVDHRVVTRRRTNENTCATATPASTPPTEAQTKSSPTCQMAIVGDDRRARRVQRDEGGGVVDQALALEDGDHPARQADAAGDGRRRDRVRAARRPRRGRRPPPARTAPGSPRRPRAPRTAVVNSVAPMDSSRIEDRFARKSTSEVRIAAA